MKIAVTGGAGFFGSHVVKHLTKNGHVVFVIDDLSRGYISNLEGIDKQKLSFTRADFSDPRRASEWADFLAGEKVDILVHMASPMSHNPLDHITGVELAASYLRTLKFLKLPTVYISSSSANTDLNTRGLRGQSFQPEGLYGMTKMFLEWALFDLRKAGLIPNYVALRPSNLYGPNEVFSGHSHIHVIPNLIRKALTNERNSIEVLGDGSQTRPFTYVEDGVQAVLCAIQAIRQKRTIEMALIHGSQVSIRSVVEHIIKETRSSAKVVWKKGKHIGVTSRNLPRHDGKLLGWKPQVKVKEGIKKTVEWVKNHPDRLNMEGIDKRPLGSTLA